MAEKKLRNALRVTGPTKLDDEQKLEILKMFAEGETAPAICKWIKSKYSISVYPAEVWLMCNRNVSNKPLVKTYRDQYLARIKDVPIANKRIRLEDLEVSRLKLRKIIDEAEENTDKGKVQIKVFSKLLAELLAVARDEMESKPQFVQSISIGEVNAVTDEDLRRRRAELLKRIGKAVRTGVRGAELDSGGITEESEGEPPEILLAPPESVQRDELQGRSDNL